jgi:hypothetical protein
MKVIETMMLDKKNKVLAAIKSYFITNFPLLGITPKAPLLPLADLTQPNRISIGQWKTLQARRARDANMGALIPISKLERWLASPLVNYDLTTFKSPDYIRK